MHVAENRSWNRIEFIYNPQAGNRLIRRNVGVVASNLAEIFPYAHIRINPTTGPGDATDLARAAAKESGSDVLIVIAGGDGSVSEAANGLIGTEAAMLVLPFGSGNDLARTLYGRRTPTPTVILDAFKKDGAFSTKMDALRVQGSVRDNRGVEVREFSRFSVNVISIGLDSKVAITADKIQRKFPNTLGMSYMIGVFNALSSDRSWRMRAKLERDGNLDVIQRDYVLCAIGNAQYYGGGFLPHPDAKLNDGLANILTARPLKVFEIAKLLGKFRRGETIPAHIATYEQASSLVIEAVDSELVLTLDGEGYYADRIHVDTVPGVLRVALPRSWGLPPAFEAD
ncbi:diacylglycerol/lipid kinase family protein [Gleimia europaea]|uniref:YegS BmrU family lipid kinase n=1 Tax=Gleimia europaea ACS-120-V-Col10b TaxID=883069 RepID=A0A9W5RDV5_9ACTO|nr:diacylglycerol kinase family protein [Gleimia europaea]EPD30596.1 YegS//BmrU family lipid kinase [Gleimia europaea ACS-120-V-Col10b]